MINYTGLISYENFKKHILKHLEFEDKDVKWHGISIEALDALVELNIKPIEVKEAAEEIKLTEKQKAFCQLARTGWLARDENGKLYYFYGGEKLSTRSYEKASDRWKANGNAVMCIYMYDMLPDFPFITWESGCFSVEELLNKYC